MNHTLIVMIVVMFSSFLSTTILGRILPFDQFGEYSLVKNLVTVGPSIAILGLDYSYIRLYPHSHPAGVNRVVFPVTFLISVIMSGLIHRVYGISGASILLLFTALWAGSLSLFVVAYFRKTNRFFMAQWIQGGWKVMFFLLVALSAATMGTVSMHSIYLFFAIGFLVFSLFYLRIRPDSPPASAPISAAVEPDVRLYLRFGVLIWLVNGLTLLFGSMDKLLIPIFSDQSTLGVYSGISFVFTISFTLFGSAVGYVLFPSISRGEPIDWRRIVLHNGLILAAMMVFFLFAGETIVGRLFNDKFVAYTGLDLVFLFSLLGVLRFIHTVFHFIILSMGSRLVQTLYIASAILASLILAASFYLARSPGGIDVSTIARLILAVWVVKTGLSGVLIMRIRKSEKQAVPA